MSVAMALVWPLLIGFLMVRALGCDWNVLSQVCLGAGVGVGAISCCFFLELETGIPSLAFELLLLAGSGAVCYRNGRRRNGLFLRDEVTAAGWCLTGILAVMLAVSAYGFVAFVSRNPHGSWDAWAIWNLHARFLISPYWRELFTSALGWTHPDYPLLLPGFIARVWSTLGEHDLATPAIVAFLFTFGTIGLLGGAVATLKGRTQGLLAALFLAATPYFIVAARPSAPMSRFRSLCWRCWLCCPGGIAAARVNQAFMFWRESASEWPPGRRTRVFCWPLW
jgi:hypothetical protein